MKTIADQNTEATVFVASTTKTWDRKAFTKVVVSESLTVYVPEGGFKKPEFGAPGYLIDPENWV